MPSHILRSIKSSSSQSLLFLRHLSLMTLFLISLSLRAQNLVPIYRTLIQPYKPLQLQQYGHAQLAWHYRKEKPDSAHYHIQHTLRLSPNPLYDPQVAFTHSVLAFGHKGRKDYPKALSEFEKAYSILSPLKDTNATALALINIGNVLTELEKDSLALTYYVRAFKIFPPGNQEAKAIALTQIAKSNALEGESLFQIKEMAFKRALEVYHARQDSHKILAALLNLGNLYSNEGFLRTALSTYRQAVHYRPSGPATENEIKLKQSIGATYLRLGEYPESLRWLQSALQSAEAKPDSVQMAKITINLSNLYSLMGNTLAAEKILRPSIEGLLFTRDHKAHAKALCNLGVVTLEQNKLSESKALFLEAKELLSPNDPDEVLNNINYNLGLVSSREGDYKAAGEYFSTYADSTYNLHLSSMVEADIRNIAQEASLKAQALQHDLDLTTTKSSHQRQLLLAALIGLILFSIIIGLLLIILQQRSRTLKAEREKSEAAHQKALAERAAIEAEHQKALAERRATEAVHAIDQLLSAQESRTTEAMVDGIEQERQRIAQAMHDSVGMMLSTIKLYLQPIEDSLDRQSDQNREQFAQVLWLIDKVMEEVRRISHNLETTVLRNFGLPAALNDLRETIRKNQAFDFDLIVSGFDPNRRLPLDFELQALRILQELVGNAMKYAQAKTIIAQAILNHTSLHLEVYDDGLGFDAESPNFKPGLGLRSIEERLKRWNGTIDIDSGRGNGTTINVEIQLPHPIPPNP